MHMPLYLLTSSLCLLPLVILEPESALAFTTTRPLPSWSTTFQGLDKKELRWNIDMPSSELSSSRPYLNTKLYSSASENDEKKSKKKKGYKFGDITKSVINRVTKKPKDEPYEFGDLSRYLDKQSKAKIAQLSKKEEYEFGDLSRYIDSKVKSKVNEFTNKGNYKFGDLTKEIVRRVSTRDFQWTDMITLFKILMTFGVGISPVSSYLPTKFLIELLEVSILQDVTGRLTSVITVEIDKRMKKALTGDEEYQLGDLAKNQVYKFIGKEKYEFGDITKTILEATQPNEETKDIENVAKTGSENKKEELSLSLLQMKDEAAEQLEDWDTKFLASQAKENKNNK